MAPPDQKSLFQDASGEWLKYANLKVSYVTSGASDIRVSFPADGQSWSYVGRSALQVEPDKATILLGHPLQSQRVRGAFLHEIGHALGLVHEFQNPQAQPLYNQEAVLSYFRTTMQWREEQVRGMFFDANAYPGSRSLDRNSVMSYELPPQLFKSGAGFSPGNDLSASDREYIGRLYPRSS